jgi:hypothetical protein
MKLKRKYLHVEVFDGRLYIYASNESFGGETMTLAEMGVECQVARLSDKLGRIENIHKKIPLKNFINE